MASTPEYNKQYKKDHPNWWKKYSKSKKGKEANKRYKKSKKGKMANKRYKLKMRYGISLEEYNEMFNEQDGKCAICGIHQSLLSQSLSVDHNHITGDVRALLCNDCNLLIGHCFERIETLKKAIKYLKKYGEREDFYG